MKISVPLSYVTISDDHAELELFTASEACQLLGVTPRTWGRWVRDGWIPGYPVDRTKRIHDHHQLDTAAMVDGPVREFLRTKKEPVEEVTRA